MVLKYRNCSIAHLLKETSAVNTMKCLLKLIHKIGITFNKSFTQWLIQRPLVPIAIQLDLSHKSNLKRY